MQIFQCFRFCFAMQHFVSSRHEQVYQHFMEIRNNSYLLNVDVYDLEFASGIKPCYNILQILIRVLNPESTEFNCLSTIFTFYMYYVYNIHYTMYMHTLKCTHFPGTSRAILIQRRCYFRSPCYYEYIARSTFCFCRHHVFVEKAVRYKM